MVLFRFTGFEKGVVMMTKRSGDSPFNSFVGKGLIDLPPQAVYNAIRNPQLRFTYDNMLKVGPTEPTLPLYARTHAYAHMHAHTHTHAHMHTHTSVVMCDCFLCRSCTL